MRMVAIMVLVGMVASTIITRNLVMRMAVRSAIGAAVVMIRRDDGGIMNYSPALEDNGA